MLGLSHTTLHRHAVAALPAGCNYKCSLARPQVIQHGTACKSPHSSNLSNTSASRTRVTCSAKGRRPIADMTDLPTTLEAAHQELAAVAAPGTSWSPKAQAAIHSAQKALGDHFFLMSCGHYSEEHPQAGQPAYALFQLMFVAVSQSDDPNSAYKAKKVPYTVEVLQQPEDSSVPMVQFVAFELDSNGWPTGAAYNSATAFERLTDNIKITSVLSSCRIMSGGQELSRLQNYVKYQLMPRGVTTVPRPLARVVQVYARDQLAAAGIEVHQKADAVVRSRASRHERLINNV